MYSIFVIIYSFKGVMVGGGVIASVESFFLVNKSFANQLFYKYFAVCESDKPTKKSSGYQGHTPTPFICQEINSNSFSDDSIGNADSLDLWAPPFQTDYS